jgi:hypothetical protein
LELLVLQNIQQRALVVLQKKRQKRLLENSNEKKAIERELFMKKLESKPDQKKFFQLIR